MIDLNGKSWFVLRAIQRVSGKSDAEITVVGPFNRCILGLLDELSKESASFALRGSELVCCVYAPHNDAERIMVDCDGVLYDHGGAQVNCDGVTFGSGFQVPAKKASRHPNHRN